MSNIVLLTVTLKDDKHPGLPSALIILKVMFRNPILLIIHPINIYLLVRALLKATFIMIKVKNLPFISK